MGKINRLFCVGQLRNKLFAFDSLETIIVYLRWELEKSLITKKNLPQVSNGSPLRYYNFFILRNNIIHCFRGLCRSQQQCQLLGIGPRNGQSDGDRRRRQEGEHVASWKTQLYHGMSVTGNPTVSLYVCNWKTNCIMVSL